MFSDDANTNASVIGSNGQTYTPWFQEIDSCTNFNNGDFNVSPGQTVSGCVLFQMPQGVAVQSVQWKPVLSSTGPATWTVH